MSDELQAGREMDASVSRVVFGREVEAHARWVYVCNRPHHQETDLYFVGTLDMLPRYSTDIREAWTVFDHLVEIGLQVLLSRDPGDPYEVEVCTTETLYEQGYRGCVVTDPSAPLAICRAAIKALESPS